MSAWDKRKIMDGKVYTKAIYITVIWECARQYGARSKTKETPGILLDTITKKTKIDRTITFIIHDYVLGRIVSKREGLHVRSFYTFPTDAKGDIILKNATTDT